MFLALFRAEAAICSSLRIGDMMVLSVAVGIFGVVRSTAQKHAEARYLDPSMPAAFTGETDAPSARERATASPSNLGQPQSARELRRHGRMRRGNAWVGCSGWQYKHWRGDFYPANLPVSQWFDYYARRFATVEINSSFYRLPERATFAAWSRRAPARFIFAVKASRFLTHMKKLKDPEEPLDRLFTRLRGLDKHLGPVLYQLPSAWKADVDRFAHFLDALPRHVRHVVEFRDPSWNAPPIRTLMNRRRVSMCLHDMPGSATGKDRVGPIVYVRFHGATGKYEGGYSSERLRGWAAWLNAQRAAGCDVYAYFNNDVAGQAPRDALALMRAMQDAEP